MLLPYASQDIDLRFVAMVSSAGLALMGMLAAVMLTLTGPWPTDYNVQVWWLYKLVSTLGPTTIAVLWCYYMIVLGFVFSYRRTDIGDWVLIASFIFVGGYELIVMIASASPWISYCMSVM